MSAESIVQMVAPELSKVLDLMESSLFSDIDILNYTNKAILKNGGKHLRPILTLLFAKAVSGGAITEDTLRFAAAVELLHNATLLHDDVADNSKSRRGVPTTNSILGERASVLIGDYWLVKAVDKVIQADSHVNTLIRLFSKTLSNLAEGEMLQLQKAGTSDTTEVDYLKIIYNKTASLFETAAICGAMSVDADQERLKAAKEYARNLGLAFQIKDDILDYVGGDAIGKPVGQDLNEQKITLPLLCVLELVPDEKEIRNKISRIHDNLDYQAEIVGIVNKYNGVELASEKLNKFVEKAVVSLRAFPDSPYRESLKTLAYYSAKREL